MFWGLSLTLAAVLVSVAHFILTRFFGYDYLGDRPSLVWLNIIVYLPLGIMAIVAARRYPSGVDLNRRRVLFGLGIAATCMVAVVLNVYLHLIFRGFVHGSDITWHFTAEAMYGSKIYVVAGFAYVLLREAALRGIVMGEILDSGTDNRNAIFVSVAFQVLAAIVDSMFSALALLLRGFGGALELLLANFLPTIVGAIVIGVTFGLLRVVTGRLWPCIATGILASLIAAFIQVY